MNPIIKNVALKLCETAPASVLEILFEILINTWNDYIQEQNLPFRTIDVTDLRGMTAPDSSSDLREDINCNFCESHPDDSKHNREVPMEKLDEQLFFDYFREHLESCSQGKLLNRKRDEKLPKASSDCRQENLAPFDNPDTEIMMRKEDGRGKKHELFLMKSWDATRMESTGFEIAISPEKPENNPTSQAGKEELRSSAPGVSQGDRIASLGASTGQQPSETGVDRDQQKVFLNSEEVGGEKVKKSKNDDWKYEREVQVKVTEICIESQNNTTEENNNYSTNYERNTPPEFPELYFRNSDRLVCPENEMVQRNCESDLISETKSANSSEFNLVYSLESISLKQDHLSDFVEFERLRSKAENITKKCLENISSDIKTTRGISSLEEKRNNIPLTFWNDASDFNKSNILPHSSKAEIFGSGLCGLKAQHSKTDLIPKSTIENYVQMRDYFLEEPTSKESGSRHSKEFKISALKMSPNSFKKDLPYTKIIAPCTEDYNLERVNGLHQEIRFANERDQQVNDELSRIDSQGPRRENKPFTNEYTPLKQLNPSDVAFWIADTQDLAANCINQSKKGTGIGVPIKPPRRPKPKVMEKLVSKLSERHQDLLWDKNMCSSIFKKDSIIWKESQLVKCPSTEKASTMKTEDKFDGKKCFKTEDIKHENSDKRELVTNEESGLHETPINFGEEQSIGNSLKRASNMDLGDSREGKLKELPNENCKRQGLVVNEEPSSCEVHKCGDCITTAEVTVNEKHDVKTNNMATKSQSPEKMNKATLNNQYSKISTCPYDVTEEKAECEDSDAQNSDAVGKKSSWIHRFHSLVIFGNCPECKEIQCAKRDVKDAGWIGNSRKETNRQTYYREKRCRCKSKTRDETEEKPSKISKKAEDPLRRKRVTFTEDSSVFCYDPKESIMETFWQSSAMVDRASNRTSRRSGDRSTSRRPHKIRSSLKTKTTCKPPRKNLSLLEDRGVFLHGAKQDIFEKSEEGRMTEEERKVQAEGDERCNQVSETATEIITGDVEGVRDVGSWDRSASRPPKMQSSPKTNSSKKSLSLLEDDDVFLYGTNQSVVEKFKEDGMTEKEDNLQAEGGLRCNQETGTDAEEVIGVGSRGRSRNRFHRIQSSLKTKITYRPLKKSLPLLENGGIFLYDIKQSIVEKFESDRMVEKERSVQAKGDERWNQETETGAEMITSDADGVIDVKDEEGYVNAAFVDVPAFDCVQDLEGANPASISAIFDEDEELLSGERSDDKSRAFPLRLMEMSRHAECSMRRWIRDSLLVRKRLSFKRMKSSLLNK